MLGERQPSLFDQDYGGRGLGPLKKGEPNAAGQSDQLVLYTPNTGLPDLELKIAYGLARVAFEAGLEFEIVRKEGWYEVRVRGSQNAQKPSELLEGGFRGVFMRLLTAERVLQLPPMFPKGSTKSGQADIKKFLYNPKEDPDPSKILREFRKHPRDTGLKRDLGTKEPVCRHNRFPLFGEKTGLLLGPTFVTGKVYTERNTIQKKNNLLLCKACGLLAMLGYFSTALIIRADKNQGNPLVVLPVPSKTLSQEDYEELLITAREVEASVEATKEATKESPIPEGVPFRAINLVIFARYPHLLRVQDFIFSAFSLKKGSRKGVLGVKSEDVSATRKLFLAEGPEGNLGVYDPFVVAYINRLTLTHEYKRFRDIAGTHTFRALGLISDALSSPIGTEARHLFMLAARESFIGFFKILEKKKQTDYPEKALLPWRVGQAFLRQEVVKMDPKIYHNPHVQELAELLRYFVLKRNFQYVDSIRAAKDAEQMQVVIATALRDAESRRGDKNRDSENKWVPIVHEDTIKALTDIANSERFEDLKYALVILAFTRPRRNGETKEVSDD